MRLLARSALAALAGVAAGLSFEPHHWVALLPFAVAGLTLLAAAAPRLRSGFWLGLVFGTAFMLVLLPWLQVIGVYAWIPLAIVEGLFYGLAGLATRAVRRLPGWPVWAATSWVLVEALRGVVPFGGFPWGRLAFATEDTPLAPTFAYVGAAGVTFLVALVGTTLAWAVLRARRTPVRAVVGLAAAALLACLASLVPFDPGGPDPVAGGKGASVVVAAVQGNVPGQGLEAFAERRAVLDNHVDATLKLARRVQDGAAQQPDLVIWPENSSDIDPYTDPSAEAAIGDATRAIGAPLLMGAVVGDRPGSGWHNRAIVWSTAGEPGRYYDKTHPVPFGEYIPLRSVLAPLVPALDQIPSDMVPGTRPGLFDVGPARAGVLMCFEVAYDGLVRDLVERRRRPDRGADQQRDVHRHRADRAAVRDVPAAGDRDRPLGGGRVHQRHLRHRRPGRRGGRPRPRARAGGAGAGDPPADAADAGHRAGAWPELALAGISVISASWACFSVIVGEPGRAGGRRPGPARDRHRRASRSRAGA